MQFKPSFNIWCLTTESLQSIQPGQWVYAGDKNTMGRFLGVKPSGSVVVAWKHNKAHVTALRVYAKK